MDAFIAIFPKLLTGIHLAAFAAFFASALFLDMAVLGALRYIPPDQATKLSKFVEPRFFLVSTVSLGVLAVSGGLLAALLFLMERPLNGTLLAQSAILWAVLAASQAYYWSLRPKLPQAFPFDVFRASTVMGDVEAQRVTVIARMVLRAQAIACMLAVVVIGGAVRYGG